MGNSYQYYDEMLKKLKKGTISSGEVNQIRSTMSSPSTSSSAGRTGGYTNYGAKYESNYTPNSQSRYLSTRISDKADKSSSYDELKKLPWFQEQKKREYLYKFRDNPNSVTREELEYIVGRRKEIPDARKDPNYFKNKMSIELATNQDLINQVTNEGSKKQNGLTLFNNTIPLELLKRRSGNENTYILDQELGSNDQYKLEQAKKDGYNKVLTRWNGKVVEMDINDANKYANSWFNRRAFNWKNKDIKDYAGDGLKYGAKYAWNILENGFSTPTRVVGAMIDGKSDTNPYIEGAKNVIRTFNGHYIENPDDKYFGKDLLRDANYRNMKFDRSVENSLDTKALGFGIDVVSGGLNPGSLGKSALMKGGRVLSPRLAQRLIGVTAEKNNAKVAQKLSESLYKYVGMDKNIAKNADNAHISELIDAITNQVKTTGKVDDKAIEQLINQQKTTRFTAPQVPINKNSQKYIDRLQEQLNNTRKNNVSLENNWSNNLQNEYDKVLRKPKDLVKRLNNGLKKTPLKGMDINDVVDLSTKSPNEIIDLLKQKRTLQAYGLNPKTTEVIPTGQGIQNLNVAKTPNPEYQNLSEMLTNTKNLAEEKRLIRQGKYDSLYEKKGDKWVSQNKPVFDLIKQQAMNPLFEKRGIGFRIPGTQGIEIIPRPVIDAFQKVTGLNKISNAMAGSKLGRAFNNKYNVANIFQDLVNQTQGKINYGTSESARSLEEILKGVNDKSTLEDATAVLTNRMDKLSTPNHIPESLKQVRTVRLPDGTEKTGSIIDLLKEIRQASVTRESAYKNLEPVANYMPGVHRASSEKKLADVMSELFGDPSMNNRMYMNPHKQKVFKDLYDAEEVLAPKGITTEKNAGQLLLNREAKSHEWTNKEELSRTAKQLQKLNPQLFNQESKQYLDNFINPKHNPRGLVATKAKEFNDFWRTAIMNTVPATFMRNIYGGIVNNSLSGGVSPSSYGRAMKVGKDGVTLRDGTKLSAEEYRKLAMENGIDAGVNRHDLNSTLDYFNVGKKPNLNPLSKNNVFFRGMGKGHEVGEGILRNSRFIQSLDEYGLAGAKTAGDDVRKAHFDYNPQTSLTKTEQGLRDFVFPFYTFQRFNLPFQLKAAAEHPARMNFWGNTLNRDANQEEGDVRNSEFFPEYMRNSINTGLKDSKGNPLYMSTNFNSVNDLKEWDNPVNKLASALNPLLKATTDYLNPNPYQLGSGQPMREDREALFGQDGSSKVMDKAPWLADLLGMYTKKNEDGSTYNLQDVRKQVALKDAIPQLQNLDSFMKSIQKDEKNGTNENVARKLLGHLSGFTTSPVDVAKSEEYAAKDEIARQNDILAGMEKRGQVALNPDYNENSLNNTDIDTSWVKEKDWYNTVNQRIADGQADHPYVADAQVEVNGKLRTDKYGQIKVVYDVFGNKVGVQYQDNWYSRSHGMSDYQKQMMDALQGEIEAGQKQSQIDQAKFMEYQQKGVPTLDQWYGMYGQIYPYNDYKNWLPWEKKKK